MKKPNTVAYMGCVGKDFYSEIIEKKARADGVDVRYQYTDKKPTGIKNSSFTLATTNNHLNLPLFTINRNMCCNHHGRWKTQIIGGQPCRC